MRPTNLVSIQGQQGSVATRMLVPDFPKPAVMTKFTTVALSALQTFLGNRTPLAEDAGRQAILGRSQEHSLTASTARAG